MNDKEAIFCGFVIGLLLCIACFTAACFITLEKIERNTRPPDPDLKSFIKRNAKGDQ